MKKCLFLCLIAFVLVFAAECMAAGYRNGGLVFTIPDEYTERLIIEQPETEEYGLLLSVTEKESVEALKKSGEDWPGAGWLFSVERIPEEKLHEMLCGDMFGAKVFAKDLKGDYYLFERPTDVRLVREDYTDPEGLREWTELNAWTVTMPQTIIAENSGLTSETRTNTMLDMYLARVLYLEDQDFTVSTTEYGPLSPNGADVSAYFSRMTEQSTVIPLNGEKAPDGEYVVLEFPDDGVRFDFFLADGYENTVRQVWSEGRFEMLFQMVFENETEKASGIMLNLYHMLAQHAGLYDPAADQITGTWANGRCSVTIEKTEEPGKFDVQVYWGNSASSTSSWSMTAEKVGASSSLLRYENGKHSILTSADGDEISEEVLYENGIGTLAMMSESELLWYDENGHAADGSVFVKIK